MISTVIEVVIEDGKVSAVSPQELPANGRGLLTVLPAETPKPLIPVHLVEEDGLLVVAKTGHVITSEMVKEIEASTW